MTQESRVERAIKSENSWEIAVARTELASMLNKKCRALVVRARLKMTFSEATNMAAELRAEEVRSIADRYIAIVALPDRSIVTTNDGICEIFRFYFQDLLTGIPV